MPAEPADRQPSVAVIGAGPAGLAAAEAAGAHGLRVVVFDAMPSPARKFLMAGRSGLNLTHAEPLASFKARYGRDAGRLEPFIEAFAPDDLRRWAEGLGEATTVGSSGRVFPAAWKASPLLRAWLRRLAERGVEMRLRHRWVGIRDGTLLFDTHDGPQDFAADAVVLALGGASWPRLGSDGAWAGTLMLDGVGVAPFRPANMGLLVPWSPHLLRFAGTPLKRIGLAFGGCQVRGEAVISQHGLEGGAVYAVAAAVRDALDTGAGATVRIDLRPDLDLADLAGRLGRGPGKRSLSTFLGRQGFPPVAVALMREAERTLPAEPMALARLAKAVPLAVAGTAGLDRAISSAGGIVWPELNPDLMIRRLPGVFAAGEMIDWEAPTGGYLLQACFATGVAAGRAAAAWARAHPRGTAAKASLAKP